jgi:hypothetical protein
VPVLLGERLQIDEDALAEPVISATPPRTGQSQGGAPGAQLAVSLVTSQYQPGPAGTRALAADHPQLPGLIRHAGRRVRYRRIFAWVDQEAGREPGRQNDQFRMPNTARQSSFVANQTTGGEKERAHDTSGYLAS